ncbi:MAG: CSLREA domain-containing protein [Chloroflexi bacterium]|nr:CSLREA domain-containing protein [Chloroflexota bacterium]
MGLPGMTITVDSTADDLTDNGNCTLREAVEAANTKAAVDMCPAGALTTTIMVPAGTYTLTIPGNIENNNQTGDLDILSNVVLMGAASGKPSSTPIALTASWMCTTQAVPTSVT